MMEDTSLHHSWYLFFLVLESFVCAAYKNLWLHSVELYQP